MDKAYNEIVFKNDQSPDLDEINMNAISHGLATVDDRVIELKGDLTELNDYAISMKNKLIEGGTLERDGRLLSQEWYDMYAYKVVEGTTIDYIGVTDQYNLVLYGFFVNEPFVDSYTYNKQREIASDTQVIENVVVPKGCNWIVVRTNKGTKVTFKYKDVIAELSKVGKEQFYIDASRNTNYIKDLNDVTITSFYRIAFGVLKNIPNSPFTSGYADNQGFLIETYKLNYGADFISLQYVKLQDDKNICYRMYISTKGWEDWVYQSAPTEVTRDLVYIGNGQQYTSLTTGLAYAFGRKNCDVFIGDGTYDLIAEGTISRYSEGIPLGNNCRYFFSSGAKVVCNYTGSSNSIMENFSCFKTGDGSSYGDYFELHNCKIEASKIRYCLHDEAGREYTTKPYLHIYEGCNFTIDNSENPIKQGEFYHCIGGGLGNSADVRISNCKFNSSNKYIQATDPVVHADVSYHGNWASTEQAKNGHTNITVVNSWFAHAFQISAPNTETDKKHLMFVGNTYHSSETTEGVYYNLTSSANWDVDAWNNYNRQ